MSASTILIAPGHRVQLKTATSTASGSTTTTTTPTTPASATGGTPTSTGTPPTTIDADGHPIELTGAADQRVVLTGTGMQGPAGPAVLLRRVGTSAVVEWRWNVRGVPWQKLIDLGDGAIVVQRQPPVLTVTGVEIVDDPLQAGVDVVQPEPLADAYNLTFRIPRGPQGERGERGYSAYDVWLQAGFSGTPQDFIAAIATGWRFVQHDPAEVWEITHPLQAQFPNVSITDSTGRRVEGDVTYTGPHTLTITFSAQISGEAYLT